MITKILSDINTLGFINPKEYALCTIGFNLEPG